MERKEINPNYDAVEKLVKIIEAEKEEPNEKNEYAVYLRRAEEAARKAEAAARRAEVASWKAVKCFKKGKRPKRYNERREIEK
jgi:hypothetical protein